ncbi:Uncharacterized protein TCM_024182 [Theobroma cacao]|uniref:RNase H type-1 domain-containing protein n=1 Tax=Theobroma cacao TaxID=3641 RepID=A0A061EVR6_THECC|nr:Uncharacterized protein TCM_024182 [Theobroma cacao]
MPWLSSRPLIGKDSKRAVCIPPRDDELKLNVDGLIRGKVGLARCGGVLRDKDGNVVGILFGIIQQCTSLGYIRTALDLFIISS